MSRRPDARCESPLAQQTPSPHSPTTAYRTELAQLDPLTITEPPKKGAFTLRRATGHDRLWNRRTSGGTRAPPVEGRILAAPRLPQMSAAFGLRSARRRPDALPRRQITCNPQRQRQCRRHDSSPTVCASAGRRAGGSQQPHHDSPRHPMGSEFEGRSYVVTRAIARARRHPRNNGAAGRCRCSRECSKRVRRARAPPTASCAGNTPGA